jgi:HlyD family secretion protein
MQQDFDYDERGERISAQRPCEKYGLQGAATVLELRRLQEAFDREFSSSSASSAERKVSRSDQRSGGGRKRKRREEPGKRSVMGKVVNACLQSLGFGSGSRAADAREEAPRAAASERDARIRSKVRAPRPSRRDGAPHEPRSFENELRRPALKDLENELAAMLAEPGFMVVRQNENRGLPVVQTEIGGANSRQARNRDLTTYPIENEAKNSKSTLTLANHAIGSGLQQARRSYNFLVNHPSDVLDLGSNAQLQNRVARSLDNELRTGLRVLLAGLATFGGWAIFMPLASAIAVPGLLVAETSVKKVQHSTGGVVAQILARDGMRVKEGEIVLRLDETQTRTNRQVLTAQLNQVRARLARLAAERDGLKELTFAPELEAQAGDREVDQLLASERSLFRARADSRQNQKELLQSHIVQLEGEIQGLEAQLKSRAAQIELIKGELKGVQGLFERHLVPVTRLTTLQREAARLEGEQAQMSAAISESHAKTNEAKLQIEQIDQSFRSEVLKDLRESQDKEAELAERSVLAKDQLDRVEIRAPAAGVVHQLSVHTVGGVISPAEVIMEIVPDTDELQIEAHIPPNEIDHVRERQKAMVRLSAFNQRTTPQLEGLVSYVAADLTRDKQSNAGFYTVRVTLPGDQRRKLGNLQLVSGMPAEVFLQTGTRTMMSYLLKPISDQLERTFNEP